MKPQRQKVRGAGACRVLVDCETRERMVDSTSRVGWHKKGLTGSTFPHEKRDGGSSQCRALGVYTWDTAREHDHHPGPCPRQVGEIMRSCAQTAELPRSLFQWWMDDTWMMVETKLRVPPWLAIATIVKVHHMSTTCAAWGRPRCPHVMTTTLCVNAQELR